MPSKQDQESWRRKAERVDLAVAELNRYRQKVQVMLDELMKPHERRRTDRKKPGDGPS